MNRDGDKSAQSALRSQRQPRTHLQVSVQKKKKIDPTSKDAQSGSFSKDTPLVQCDSGKEVKAAGLQGKRAGRASSCATAEWQRSPGAQRKLSDASNASEDLSKDSGCMSGKLSSSDSSSEISDCPSEGNKNDSPGSDELSWIQGRAYVSPDSEGKVCPKIYSDTRAVQPDTPGGGLSLLKSPEAFIELMMVETTEDLVREVEDLRSENEYLKDEVEELRCEMLEMRDMYQEEAVYQLQELRLQLEQANKTCRILHYRLRKAERRSIRVAQTGQVDGELVRSLEHDIKVAKSVSFRLCSELEVVQKKNSQLEWENEALREKTQELEVAKQVLQAEVEKARECSLKKKSIRSTVSRAEKRLSQQLEDDSSDLKNQLHFAKEELALMCKKLTKLASESEGMREELAKYHTAYGDIDVTQSSEDKRNSAHSREAEVKVHLKLVEEEATLLSRRIVELEVENRGLRAEMSDLREKIQGGGMEEEEQENRDVVEKNASPSMPVRDKAGSLKLGCATNKKEEAEKGKSDVETFSLCNPSHNEGMITACHIAREGPVGGEWDPPDSQEGENHKTPERVLKGMTVNDYETLIALRDHSCILSSAIQFLTKPPKHGHCSSSSCAFNTEVAPNSKAQQIILPGPLNQALELLQTMLVAFIGRVESFLPGNLGKDSVHKDGHVWDSYTSLFFSGCCADHVIDCHNVNESPSKPECVKDLHATMDKERATRQAGLLNWEHVCSSKNHKVELSLQILWILHQWCQCEDKTLSVLQGLLQNLSEALQDKQKKFNSEAKASECAVSGICHEERHREAAGICSSKGQRQRQLSPHSSKTKNWFYLSQEAAQLDKEDPVKTWDHPIMPLSFPDLDFEQMAIKRSHTAPEKSAFRIYYSPPSARRVQQAQLNLSPITDRESVNTPSPWCTPLTSFSLLCLGSSANLSDDMKEMTATWRQTGHGNSQEKTGRLVERWANVVSSGTQTHMKPQMVSVGLQTDGSQGPVSVRNSPARVLTSSLVAGRSHHISTSLDKVTEGIERPVSCSTSSPKLYRRHSASGVSSLPSSSSLSSSTSSLSPSRARAPWHLNHQSHTSLSLARQSSPRAGARQNHSPQSSTKPPSKPSGTNRYGLVTEFLRRVSGRGEKPALDSGQKTKSGLKSLERVPTRPPAVPLHRNDSVTRVVNQRFMKQKEESGRAQREEKGRSLNHCVKHNMSTATVEDGSYDCSSSSTLTFCIPRPSRSTQRQTLTQSKLHRHRYSAPVSAATDSNSNQQHHDVGVGFDLMCNIPIKDKFIVWDGSSAIFVVTSFPSFLCNWQLAH
ncbi:Protein SOGA1 SOGA family member 1 [Channa argus]|uniref:Protein SOGA1 SOGA family member 1 n=1 Tax=Channa argus TaxID=215402 RepID=A0A6G1Q4U8_CHAAH|nr:Protein SOGA1 SOGA family member 1 [Channa argus]